MDGEFHDYSLATRLSHLLTTVLLAALYLTGVRLAWFSGSGPLFPTNSLLDQLLPTGQVYWWHAAAGVLLIACGIFYLSELILSGQTGRMTALFTDRRRDYRKKLFYIAILATVGISTISGITLYMGLYEGVPGHAIMNGLHHYCAALLAILILAHLIDVLFGKDSRMNTIFFAVRNQQFFKARRFVLSMLAAVIVGGAIWVTINSTTALECRKLTEQVHIDGKIESSIWDQADSLHLTLAHGANFESGVSEVTLKSFHNGQSIFFLVQWDDPDRSCNRRLLKSDTGWVRRVSEYLDLFGESIYSEDQLALSFHRGRGGCAATCHVRTPKKMGLHYTDGDTVDVWQWRAASTNPIGRADDGWWAAYRNDSLGGRHLDNLASGGYFSNLNRDWQQPYFLPVHPSGRGWIDPRSEYVTPYFFADDNFAVGDEVPGVIVTPFIGDRGDVRARGRWFDGRWAVEFTRPIKTGSSFDIELRGEFYLGIALFDNAESKHAFHLRPIRVMVK